MINNEHILDLTARRFLTDRRDLYYTKKILFIIFLIIVIINKIIIGSMIQSYLNGRSLNDLHPSLNNNSKINYYIEKTRYSQFPFGQNILGVAHEFMKHERSENPYIRSIRKFFN